MQSKVLSLSQPGYYFPGELDAAAVRFYQENGYLVVLDAIDLAGLDDLVAETVAICRGKRGIFLKNGEVPAYMAREHDMSDDEVQRELLCIHQQHKHSATIHSHLAERTIVDVLTRVIGPNVKCMQSMLFIKSAGKPG